jgi:hypothetical protein
MAKSRSVAMLALLGTVAGPVAAQQATTAEEAEARFRQVFAPTKVLDCPEAKGDEIVVCAREGEHPARLPLPIEPEPGRIVRGEASGMGAMAAGGCLRLCQSSVGIDLKMAKQLIDVVGRLIEGDD